LRERMHTVPIVIRLYVGAVLSGAALFAVFLLVSPGGHRHVVLVDDIVRSAVPLILASAWGVDALFRRRRLGEARPILRASLCLCLSAVSFALGQLIWTYYENVLHHSPFPSWADVPFLTAYPFLVIGTFSLATPPRSLSARIRMSLDAMICLISLVIISWYVVLGPALLQVDMNFLAKFVGTAYPCLDVVIFSSLLLLTMNAHNRQLRPAIGALLTGSICIIVADTLYDYQSLRGSYHTGSVFDVLSPLGYSLVVVSALLLNREAINAGSDDDMAESDESLAGRRFRDASSNRWRVLVPSVLVLGAWALVVIILATPGNQSLQPVMAVAAGLLAFLVVFRQVLTSHDNDRLLEDLRGAWRETVARSEEVEGMNAALEESREKFKSAFEHAANGMALVDSDGKWIQVNRALCNMTGYSEAELLDMRFQDITHPDDLGENLREVARLLHGVTDSYRSDKRYFHKDGHVIWVSLTVSTVWDPVRGAKCFIAQIQDVTEHKRSEADRRQTEQRYRSLVETSADGILFVDLQGKIVMANRHAAKLHGYAEASELVGMDALHLVTAAYYEQAQSHNDLVMQGGVIRGVEYPARRKDGTAFPAEMSAARIVDEQEQPNGYMASVRDVTDRKKAQEKLAHQARHDALTGLPNRTLLRDHLDEAMATHASLGTPVALLFMDLNRFKEVNDTFGHHYGDALLEQLSRRLSYALRSDDTIARLGGDEFAALLPGAGMDQAKAVAGKLLSAVDAAFVIEGQDFYVGISVGIALCPEHGQDATVLMRRADIAMYAAKRTGNGCVVYSPEQDDTNPVRHELMRDLRRAIEHGGLILHYQPQVDLRTDSGLQVEALIRWEHPNTGFAPPASFVPLAEETGLIKPLTTWVLNEALRQVAVWRKQGLDVQVAVNLSARSLHDADLVNTVESALKRWEVPPRNLALEITESAIIVDPHRAMQPLAELHAMGVRFAIDDFGTGYSSLSYLQRLPIDQIKVDRSFVMDMTTNGDNAVIVRSILDLAHSLGMEVVAEGVETSEILDALDEMRCDLIQGYHVCRPVDAESYAAWYRKTYEESPVAEVKVLPIKQSAFG
jgi:diguanylate cyclase (GGDEF)-like protein/PAS domain S-box-containing protein